MLKTQKALSSRAQTVNSSQRWLAVLAGCTMIACVTPTYRFDRRKYEGIVEHRDLEQLILDGESTGGSLPEVSGALSSRIVEYDFSEERDEYRIGANDVLNIFYVGHPEMSSQRIDLGQISGTKVQKDGYVYIPVIGRVLAAGKSVIELRESLMELSARFIVDPQVTVEILEYGSQKFFVLGQVNRPGVFPVDGDTSLLEGLSLAGGVQAERANLEAAHVVRSGRLLPINVADMLLRGDVSRNVFMRHGDVVYVPDNLDQKVYVIGEVVRPVVVPMVGGRITLAQALAEAGGPQADRARRELAVIRGGFAKPRVYTIDLERALLYDDRILLKPGDRIVVAPTGLSTSSRYMQMLLPFLQGAQALGISAQGATNIVTGILAD